MKRFAAILLLSLTAALPAMAESDSPVGVVTSASGDSAILRRGAPMQAVEGMEIRKDDVIQSGPGGRVDVSLNNLAGCRVLPSTECLVEETAKEDMRFNVTRGNVVLNLQKLPARSKFRIETPTAVASVRGTQFWGRVDSKTGDAVTTFAVKEGVVDVLAKSAGRSFRLKQGQALDIPSKGRPAPRQALEEEMGAMAEASTIKTAA